MFTLLLEDGLTKKELGAWARMKSPAPGTPCRITTTEKEKYTAEMLAIDSTTWRWWIDDIFHNDYKDCILIETKRGGKAVAALSLDRSKRVPVGAIEIKTKGGEAWSGRWAVWWKPKENKFVTNSDEEIFFDEK